MPPKRIDVDRYRDLPAVISQIIWTVIHPYVLSGWVSGKLSNVGLGVNGARVDDILLETAKKWSIPIVTNEGSSAEGVIKRTRNLRGKAQINGVKVYTPQEFLDSKQFDTSAAAERFMSSVRAEVARAMDLDLASPAVTGAAILRLLQLYEYILLAP